MDEIWVINHNSQIIGQHLFLRIKYGFTLIELMIVVAIIGY